MKRILLFLLVTATLIFTLIGVSAATVTTQSNTSESSAATLEFGDIGVIYGELYGGTLHRVSRFYKIEIPSNGVLTISASLSANSTTLDDYTLYDCFIYNSDSSRRFRLLFSTKKSTNTSASYTVTVQKGVYYLDISGNYSFGSTDASPPRSDMTFYLKPTFQCSHIEKYTQITKKATCSQTGIEVTKCNECEEILSTKTLQKLPHTPNAEWTHLKDASCSEEGKDALYCSVCNEETEEKILEALPHTYGEWTVKTETSCAAPGEETRTCSVCSYVDSREIEALAHKYGEFSVTKEPSCSEEGEKERVCSVCSYKETKTIEKLSHDFDKWVTDAEATCTDEGERHRDCKICEYREVEELEKISHNFGTWSYLTMNSCVKDGERIRRCSDCRYEEREKINAHGHEFYAWEETKAPTEQSTGTMRRDCKFCPHYETETIPRLVCGESVEKVTVEEATCQREGTCNIVCSYCDKVLRRETVDKKGHSVTDWSITQKATRTHKGIRSGRCNVCLQTVTLSYTWELPGKEGFVSKKSYPNHFTDVKTKDWFYSYIKTSYEFELINGVTPTAFKPAEKFTVAQALTVSMKIHSAYNDTEIPEIGSGAEWYMPYVNYCIEHGIISERQFTDYNKNITRGEMAMVFANILPDGEYVLKRTGYPSDMKSSMNCYKAVLKLYRAGIIGGYEDGSYKPDNEITRSEASAIFTRIVVEEQRTK